MGCVFFFFIPFFFFENVSKHEERLSSKIKNTEIGRTKKKGTVVARADGDKTKRWKKAPF